MIRATQSHRREHERVAVFRQHVAWSRGAGEPLERARVVDVSPTGVGLETRGIDPPEMGSTVRVLARWSQRALIARVVRVSPARDGPDGGRAAVADAGPVSRVGCRWICAESHRMSRSRVPYLRGRRGTACAGRRGEWKGV